jgi:hypothetical protein
MTERRVQKVLLFENRIAKTDLLLYVKYNNV